MKPSFWVGIALIVVISFLAAIFAPVNDVYRGIFGLPGATALGGALFQLFRDQQAHERNLKLQSEQQLFSLGTTSHMANTVFDKHVAFCEKYMAEVHELVDTLTREGATRTAVNHGNALYTLRMEYAAWLTPEIDQKLEPYEQFVRELGADAGFVEDTRGSEAYAAARSQAIERAYNNLKITLEWGDVTAGNDEARISSVKNKVRKILQVDQLVAIRECLVQRAFDVLEA